MNFYQWFNEFYHQYKMRTKKMMCVVIIVLAGLVLFRYIFINTSIYYRMPWLFPKFGEYLNHYDLVLLPGDKVRLSTKSINKRLTFSTTDFKVADINDLGVITANRPGQCFAKVKVNDHVLKCRIRVISLNKENIILKCGRSVWLNVRGAILCESYDSSNNSVATVTKYGMLTAQGKGRVTITAKAYGKTMVCNVTVVD